MIDPIHTAKCDPRVAWSSGNVAEAFPGVSTPLSWTYFFDATEIACRLAFFDLGLFARAEVAMRGRVEERHMAVFFGRAASNVDTLRQIADRTPGVRADDIERQVLGTVRTGAQSHPTRRRYPAIAARAPVALARAPRRIDRLRSDTDAWWRRSIARIEEAPADVARVLLTEARDRHRDVMRAHTVVSMAIASIFDAVHRIGERLGAPELAGQALSGLGTVEEAEMACRMWEVARGVASVERFVADFGFHGPVEGQLSSRTWREDRAPLESLLHTFAGLDGSKSPQEASRREGARGADARRRLLAALPVRLRPGARAVLELGARLIPRRELGKASYLQAADVARSAARRLGATLASRGALADPEDVFFGTLHELLDGGTPDLREDVSHRRARYEEYRGYTLPPTWNGVPEPLPVRDPAPTRAHPNALRGLGVSSGLVRGRARVVADPATAKLEPGEILVCETTDPSWAALFVIAAGVVIDIGSAISHGAIVARELGVPAVVNTGDAIRWLRTGDWVEVDGSSGTVCRLASGPA